MRLDGRKELAGLPIVGWWLHVAQPSEKVYLHQCVGVARVNTNTHMHTHTCTHTHRISERQESSPEKCLLCAKDLHSGGWILGQVGQTASMRDQTSTNLQQWTIYTLTQTVWSRESSETAQNEHSLNRELTALAVQQGQQGYEQD